MTLAIQQKQPAFVPPYSKKFEEAILGAILLDTNAIIAVLDILTPDMFYFNEHQKIYNAITTHFNKSIPIDLLTITDTLRKTGELKAIGGPYYLVELTNRVASAANIEYHARMVQQKYMERELLQISRETIATVQTGTTDIIELIDTTEQSIFELVKPAFAGRASMVGDLVTKVIKNLEKAAAADGLSGVPSGFTAIDEFTHGWQKQDLIIVAARPAMGKTAYTLALAQNAAMQFDIPVAVFSLEMSNEQLVGRFLAMDAEVNIQDIKTGNATKYEWDKINTSGNNLLDSKIIIDDSPNLTPFQLRAKARRLKMQHNIGLVIVDYLQLMSGTDSKKNQNRTNEITDISRALKMLAKELDLPVVALSQLSRAVESRGGNKRPMLSDLRESGSIEQDADIVQFIYRPEYYGILEDENGETLKGMAEIITAKNRNGKTGSAKLTFTAEYAKFSDYSDVNWNALPAAPPAPF